MTRSIGAGRHITLGGGGNWGTHDLDNHMHHSGVHLELAHRHHHLLARMHLGGIGGRMSETLIVATTRLALSKGNTRLFRNNTGEAWQGLAIALPGGDILLKKPRRVNFGLCPGSSDLIGWKSVTITPNMIGKRVAVFVAPEAKMRGKKPTDIQAAFIRTVVEAGGIAGVFTSVDEARELLESKI
jgi:hypothetical protein